MSAILSQIQPAVMRGAALAAVNFVYSFVGPAVMDLINMSDAEVGLVAQAAQDNKIGSSLYVFIIGFLTSIIMPLLNINA